MITRATCLPKFNSFFRQISKNVTIYNRKVASVEEAVASNENNSSNSYQTNREANKTNAGQGQVAGNLKMNVKRTNVPGRPGSKPNAFKNFSELANQTNLNLDDIATSYSNKGISKDAQKGATGPTASSPEKLEEYEQMIKCLTNDLTAVSDTLLICQKLVELFDAEPSILTYFKAQPIKKEVIKRLALNYDKISGNLDDLLTVLQFGLKIDEKVTRVESLISSNIQKLSGDQLVKLVTLFRAPAVTLPDKQEKALKYLNHFLKSDYQNIENFSNILLAMKLFSFNPDVIRSLDEKVIRLSDQLTTKNWLDLLNTKSILRLRDVNILQACAYQVVNSSDSSGISLEDIQRSFLSCGVLHFFDEKFYKFLLNALNTLITENKLAKTAESENNLNSIINSMGMLLIRESNLLNNLCKYLHDNCLKSTKMLASFVISCGFLNFNPQSAEFKKIIESINTSYHLAELHSNKDKLVFLNYVWSTCILNCPNEHFIAKVLDESFWTSLLDEPSLKSVLNKLFNINLYTMIYLENYKGSELPAHMNAEKYADVLPVQKGPEKGSFNHVFFTTLTSFRSLDKYFKLNMLTSYGIIIDALMISDKNGMPKLLSEHFDDEMKMKLNEEENEFAVAFKLINFKDHTHIEKVINGGVSIQLNLLNELGYYAIPITHEELMGETTIINRVQLVKRKLKQAAEDRLSSNLKPSQ